MAFKDILLALTSYPEPTSLGAVDHAVTLASLLTARISAVAFEAEFHVPRRNFLADTLLDMPAVVAAELAKSAKNARDLLNAFENNAKQKGVFRDRILAQCTMSQIPDRIVKYARARDLTIVPVRKSHDIDRLYAETIIFGSGRPTLILPQASDLIRVALDVVVIAWDFSRPAARAVGDALPILEMAKLVYVVTVTGEKVIDTPGSSEDLCKHLAQHGVKIVPDMVDAEGREIGDVLGAYITSRNADLLVMGAYGHTRIRDFILGGATKSIMLQPPAPVFLSH